MKHIVKSIVEEWVKNGFIDESDSAIYYFGLYEGGIFAFDVLVTLLIAIIMQSLRTGVIFVLSFFAIRRFAGGFHAETRLRCFIISVLVIVGAMKEITLLHRCYSSYMVLISGLCAIVIGMMSPIEDRKRKLSIQEMMSHKNSALLVLLYELVLAIMLELFGQKKDLACVTMAVLVCFFLNVLEVLKRRLILRAKDR